MMRGTLAMLVLLGSAAVVAPAMASDKLPPRPAKPVPAASAASPSDGLMLLTPDAPTESAAPPTEEPPKADAPALAPAPTAEMPPDGVVSVDSYPFVLFFDWDSAELNPGAAEVLDSVAENYRRIGSGHITLSGFADRSGTGDYNRDLSQRRVAAVKSYLAGKTVPADAISTEAYGESKPLIDTADGAREPQNRRVEVTVTPPSKALSTR